MPTFALRYNSNVVPIEYNAIIQWIQNNPPVWIPKLGRSSRGGELCHFWCSVTPQGRIRVSANEDGLGSSYEYSEDEWTEICNIIQWAIETDRNPEFTYWYTNDPHHTEAPRVRQRKWGPNVPAICRSYMECNN